MKKTKKILSIFLALLMIISIIPMASITVEAASTVNDATFLTKLADAKSRFRQDEYFSGNYGSGYNLTQTSPTIKCTGTNAKGSTCTSIGYCAYGGWCTCKCGTYYYGGAGRCYQCWGFACQVGYDIFGVDSYAGWNKHKNAYNIKAGDIVRFSWSKGYEPHSVFVLKVENGMVDYADCNASGPCKVNWKNSMSVSRIQTLMNNRTESEFAVYHAPNSAVSANPGSSTPTPSINFVTGLAGQYYLQGKSTGAWLSVNENKDASTQPINTWGTWYKEFRVKLVATGNGYKINFPVISSLLMNPYSDSPTVGTKVNLYQDVNDITQWWGFEKVGDAYAIRSLYNTSLVLTDNGVMPATLTTYTGASNQLWYLHPYSTTVSYNANGGSGAPGSQTKYFNENLTLSSTKPTRSGYTFAGWGTSLGDTTVDYYAGGTYTQNSSITLYAIWTPNTYTVSYNANGGSGAPSSQTKYHNQSLTLSSTKPTRSGYTFAGWGTSSGDTTVDYYASETYTQNSSITLYAIWNANTYTISYNANGGTGAPSSQTKYHNTPLTLSSTIPTRSGYTFLGWSTSSTAFTATYQPGASFTSNANTTLYAVWQANAVAMPEVHVSSSSVNLTIGDTESTVIYAWATGVTGKFIVRYQIADTNIVSCAWGDWNSENKSPLTITAKSKGTTTVTVSLVDYETNEVLDSTIVTVNVSVSENYVDFNIKEPSTTTIRYKDGIVLHIDGYIPDGARVEWAVDSNAFDGGTYDNGMSCLLVSQNNGYTTVVATLYDANDNVIATDSVELRSKAGFFDKIGGFFRGLFGATKIYDN